MTADAALAWLRNDIDKFRKLPRDPKTGAFNGRPYWRLIDDRGLTLLRVDQNGIDHGFWA